MGRYHFKIERTLLMIFTFILSVLTVYGKDTLSLDNCIEIALENSPEIEISRANINRSELNVDDARAEFLPDISLNGKYYVNDEYNQFEWNNNHYELGISASINPFSSGRTYLEKQRAEAGLSSVREEYKLTRMNLIMEVIRRYYNLLEASQILELRKSALEQKEKQLEYSKAQFELGIVPRADTLKARATLEGAKLELQESKGELRIRRAELNESIGMELEYPLTIKPVELKGREIPESDSMLQVAFRERPEIKQQKSSISSSKYNLYIARINRMPSFTLSGGYEVFADRFVFDGEPLNSENWQDNSTWNVNVGMTFPIFDGGTRTREITKAGIELNNSRLNYENTKRQIELEVKSASISLENAVQKIDLTERQVASNRESYEAALGRYRNGIAPITEVLDAEVSLTESKVNQISAKYDFLISLSMLKKASGILYQEDNK